ncbi:protein kinase [Nonomuraea sp. MTCD27]|uniref:protein kinase domain-containing protein n=1 Tax=Nonomuraea sp. MTCD27 TaxID=1676747 RepID=UPI0035C24D0D
MAAGDPDRLGGYWVARRLGEGGQGVVYEAYDDAGGRVAVKVLRRGSRGKDFAREVAAAQRVASFCTARLIAADGSGDQPYLVSEYVEGPSLRRAVEDGGVFSGDRLHALAIGIMTALVAIHEAGVVHRDLKPDNVLLSPEGPRVIDFGIARTQEMSHSASNQVRGTPPYMSPEVLSGERAGPASDVFAWAAVVLFAATGHSPFEATTMGAIMHRVLTLEPDCEVLPPVLRSAVSRALAKPARDRPPARDLLLDLLSGRGGRGPGGALLDRGFSAAARARPAVMVASPPLGAVAERMYDALPAAERAVVPDVLLRLIQTGDGGEDVLRTADPAEVCGGRPGHETVLTALLEAGLVVRQDAGVRLANAALPRAWPRLREWLEAERPGLAIHRRLSEAARLWDRHERRPSDLYQGSALELARTWATGGRRYLTLSPLEDRFLTEGLTAAARRSRRRRQVTAALAALTLVASGAGVYAEAQRREAVTERAAVAAHLERAVARSLVIRAQGMRLADPRTAMLLNVAAWRVGPQEPETRAGLREALTHPARDVFSPPDAAPGTVYALNTTGTMLVGVREGVATVWDVAGHKRAARVTGVGAGVRQAALNHDGSLLAVRDERSVRLWDVRSGRPVGTGFGGGYTFLVRESMRFSSDGRFLRLPPGMEVQNTVWVDVRTRRALRAPGGALVDELGPDGRYAVTGLNSVDTSQVRVWDLVSGKERTLEYLEDWRDATDAVFSADGKVFATVRDGAVSFWDLATGSALDWTFADGAGTRNVALSPDGALLVTDDDDEIVVYRTADGTELSRVPFATSGVERPSAFGADGRTLRLLGQNGTVLTLRTAEPGGARAAEPGRGALGGTTAATVMGTRLEVRNAETGGSPRSLRVAAEGEGADDSPCCEVAVSPDGSLVAVGGFLTLAGADPNKASVAVLDATDLTVKAVFAIEQQMEGVSTLEFGPDGASLAVSPTQVGDIDEGSEAPMELWRWRTKKVTLLREAHANQPVAFGPDGRTLVTGTGAVMEIPSGRVVRRLDAGVPVFGPGGRSLAMAGPAGITVWDTRTWRPSAVRLAAKSASAPAFSHDGRTLAASTPAGVRLWDVATGRPMGAFAVGEEAVDLAFAPSDGLLYTVGVRGEVRAEKMDPAPTATAVCALAGHELSPGEWHRFVPELPYRRVCAPSTQPGQARSRS